MKDKFDNRALTRIALCVALISIGGYIAFPTPFSPVMITVTTLSLGVTALILPPKHTAAAIIVWILLGAAGVPVFSGGQGGIGKIAGPSGGFFLGFFFAYVGVSLCKGKVINWQRYLLVLIAVAFPLTYIFGIAYMMFTLQLELWQAMTMAMFSFIPGDIIKAVAAAFLGARLNRILP